MTAMLLRPGQIVPVSTLIAELWGDDPPAMAANLVAIYVARLRQIIGDADNRILSCPPGYLLRLQDGDLDAQRFEDLVTEAKAAHADHPPPVRRHTTA